MNLALLSPGYHEMIEPYLVASKADPGSEREARQILLDFTGEVHRRYEAEQGALVLIRPDGYIGFWGQFDATETLRGYVQALFVTGNGESAPHRNMSVEGSRSNVRPLPSAER